MDNTYLADAIYMFIRKGSVPYHKVFSNLIDLPEKFSGVDVECDCDICDFNDYLRYAASEIDKIEGSQLSTITVPDLSPEDTSTEEVLMSLLAYYMYTHPEMLDRWYFIDQYNELLTEISRKPITFKELMKEIGPEMIRVMIAKNILLSARKNRVSYYLLTPKAQKDLAKYSMEGSTGGGGGGDCDCPDLEDLFGWGSI